MGLLWISGRLPSLNQVIAESAGANKGWSAYAATKKRWAQQIALMARVKDLKPIPPSFFGYLVCEPNRRVDPSNMVGGAVKVIEDALQEAGLLQNDGWNDVLGYIGYWQVAAHRVGTLVYWGPSLPSKETMCALWAEEIGNGNPSQKAGNGTGNRGDDRPGAHAQEAAARDAPAGSKLGKRPAVGR